MSTSREWAAIGEVAPLLLAAGAPKATHLRIHTIKRMSRVPWNFDGGPVSIRLRSRHHRA